MSDYRKSDKTISDVRTYILGAVHTDKEKIKDDTLIFKEGFIDSMGFMLLITFIEEKFAIKTNDEDLIEENFESVDAIAEFICRKSEPAKCAE